jgi:hypothetical protein
MSWITLYISGKSDFRQDVRRKLEYSSIAHMPGYMETNPGQDPADLYWLDGNASLRKVKEAIGAKLIWKHRLRFYSSLEAFMASQQAPADNGFTAREREMITEMRAAS